MRNSKPQQNLHHHKHGKNSDSKQRENGSDGFPSVSAEKVVTDRKNDNNTEPNSPPPAGGKEGLLRSVLGLKSALGIPIDRSNPANIVSSSVSTPSVVTPHAPPPGFTSPIKTSSAPPGLSPTPVKFAAHSETIPSILSSGNSVNNQEMNLLSPTVASLLPSTTTTTTSSSSYLLMPTNSMPPGLQSATNNTHFLLSSYLPMDSISSPNDVLNTAVVGNETMAGGDFRLALSTMRALNIDDTNIINKSASSPSFPLPPPPGFSVSSVTATVQTITAAANPAGITSTTPTSSDKQKAAALISLMKSRVGDMTVKRVSPAYAVAKPLETTAVTEDMVSFPTTEPTNDINAIIDDKSETIGAINSNNSSKKVLMYRIVRNQTAFLHVKVRNYKTKEESRVPIGYYFRPGNGMSVEWKIPASIAERYLNNYPSSNNNNNNNNNSSNTNSSLVIGLLRYGTVTNSGCLIAKNIHLSARHRWVDSVTNEVYYIGDMPFFAPKSAGQFVYRLFDSSTKESAFDTLGTSVMFHVVLVDQDIVVNLPVILESIDKKYVKPNGNNNTNSNSNEKKSSDSPSNDVDSNSNINFIKGIAQLSQLIRGLKSCAPEFSGQVAPLLNRAVECVLEEIQRTISLLDEGVEKKKLATAAPSFTSVVTSEDATKIETALADQQQPSQSALQPPAAQSDEDVEFWTAYRQAAKVHLDAFDCFVLLQDKRNVWYILSEKLKNTLVYQQRLFCPILRRFFSSMGEMSHRRLESLQFVPAVDVAGRILPLPVQQAMTQSIVHKAAALLPHSDFFIRREKIRDLIERKLYEAKVMPEKSCLALYGSSANYFGKEDADLDMCLVLSEDNLTNTNNNAFQSLKNTPNNSNITANNGNFGTKSNEEDEKQRQEQQQQRLTILENIAQALSAHLGMTQVSTRLTARIPIVEFHDPLLNLDGDISLHNSLALCNTKLLKVYAEIDPRVRCLAYIIKHWAKTRHLNSPQDGTLSSYGFVLTLIHFLQRRPVPILPNLQQLPPNWRGGPIHASQTAACTVMATSIDGSQCNVYFLQPDMLQLQLLKRMAEENKESIAQLLLEYFRYFAWSFDTRHEVVSIRKPLQHVTNNNYNNNYYNANANNNNNNSINNNTTKLDKYEESAWFHSDVLSIEDPFEIGYDVAHVIKATQMSYMRKEFLRAYTLACRTVSPPLDSPLSTATNTFAPSAITTAAPATAVSLLLPGPDSLPNYVSPMNFVDVLCEPCEPPAFVGRRKASVSITETSAFGSTSLLQMLAASAAPSSAAAAVLSEVIPQPQAKENR